MVVAAGAEHLEEPSDQERSLTGAVAPPDDLAGTPEATYSDPPSLTSVDPPSPEPDPPIPPDPAEERDLSAGYPDVERALAWLGISLAVGVFLVLAAVGVWMVVSGL